MRPACVKGCREAVSAVGVALLLLLLVVTGGCTENSAEIGRLEAVWGRRGISDGRLQKPRAMAIDGAGRLYIVDMLARIQVFDERGTLLAGPWRTPAWADGKPTGLSIDRDGNLMVADTHYYRVLFYSPTGELLKDKTLGGTSGHAPGEFGLVTDAVQDSRGNYYVSEYGQFDRIQKFSPSGDFLLQWGGHGEAAGQFRRPQNMAVDRQDHIWVTDACNHRIQVFDGEGRLIKMWGEHGEALGQLSYPYDLALDDQFVYICEFGNNRVQKFTRDGKSRGCWGHSGRAAGQLHNPWALVQTDAGKILVLDTNNHRVQCVRM